MSHRRSSGLDAAAIGALIALTAAAVVALAVAVFKAAVAIFRWLATTLGDLNSGVRSRVTRGRARLATLATATYVLVAYALVAAHVERSPWHLIHASWEAMGAALAVAVAGLSFVTWRAATGVGQGYRPRFPLSAAGVGLAAAAIVAAVDVPTRAEVEALVRRGGINDARAGVASLELSGEAPAVVASLADAVHEREVNEAPDLVARLTAYRGQWRNPATQARVRAALEAAVTQESRGLLARNDAAALDRLGAALDEHPTVAGPVRASARLAHAAAQPVYGTDCPADAYAALGGTFGAAEIDPRRAASRARAERLVRGLEVEARAGEGRATAATSIATWTRVEGAARCAVALGAADPLPAMDIPSRLDRLRRAQAREDARAEREQRRVERAQRREERRRRRESEY